MATKRKTEKQASLARLRWVIATPYFVQGSNNLAEVPILFFIKFTLGMGDAGGQLFDSLRSIGWMIKPLWGYISDKIHIFGYHRKAWYVLMAGLGVLFWMCAAGLSAADVEVPIVYLLVFNLVFGTYAFVDVVCDAIMVVEGRRLGRVGSFVSLQWTILSVSNAGALFLGGWLQQAVDEGVFRPWVIFVIAGLFPLLTAFVGLRNIAEARRDPSPAPVLKEASDWRLADAAGFVRRLPSRLNQFRKNNHTIWLLLIFLFFWKFSPSVGFIERSYLIDVRDFSASSFGIILSIGGVTFLVSVLTYRWMVRTFRRITWYHYLYAMVAIGVLSFPISFYLYLEPDHPWWDWLYFTVPDAWNPFPHWNRYEWFRMISGTVLSFASIPAFMIPLKINAFTVKVAYAGLGYAVLTAFSNATNVLEGVVGAVLYDLFTGPNFAWLRGGFQGSVLDIANTTDTRTMILELFVYIGLVFTVLTIPFVELLRRELKQKGVVIDLGKKDDEDEDEDAK